MKYHFQLHNAYATLQYFASSEFLDFVPKPPILIFNGFLTHNNGDTLLSLRHQDRSNAEKGALPAPRLNPIFDGVARQHSTGQACRKTTRLRSGELHRGTQLKAREGRLMPEGKKSVWPVSKFVLTELAQKDEAL